ncbi:hypothetical protein HRbin22_02037 [Candidatus Thermoflexus japonica]|uniref:Uncharacterized protein n=1 Tax=Candidatus Thermoflexus japonica TaxID=2035417 RepID=A0A2H5Y8K0_9CHLR|nr:hypothetical protein HRbin22_02037 [Candidatus Thermoflexus japonica]
MGKRGKPEISIRGRGRTLFSGLTEWVEPAEPPARAPETPASEPAPRSGGTLSPRPSEGTPGDQGDREAPAPSPEPALLPEPVDAPTDTAASIPPEDGDSFRFLALEAARVASASLEIPNWAPPPRWRWEPSATPAETVEVDPRAPMRALRIPGLLTPEALHPLEGSPETMAETPVEGEQPMEQVPTPPTLPERPRAARSRGVDEAHLRQLHARIDELYRRIASGAIPDPGTAEQALAWLKQAREALLSPDGYDEAEYYYSLAQTRYAIARRLWRWSYTYGLFVFVWGIAWLGFYLWALTDGRGYSARVVPPSYEGIWEPIMWGGLGGVCGIFYSLYWHVAIRRDFDRQYVMWYLVQPLLGSMIGMIIYMIITLGFLTIQGTPTPANPLFMYLLAFIAGFRQRFFLELIDRIVQTFTPNPRSNA